MYLILDTVAYVAKYAKFQFAITIFIIFYFCFNHFGSLWHLKNAVHYTSIYCDICFK